MAGNSEPDQIAGDEIARLIAAGRHADAADAALAGGQPARAADLYEKLWDFRHALAAARAGGDLPRALRYAIELGDEAEVATALAALMQTGAGRGSSAPGSAAEAQRGEGAGRGSPAPGSAAEGQRGEGAGRGSSAPGSAAEGQRGEIDGPRAALGVLVKLRRHREAAPIAEALGEIDQAIELFTRARDELSAARLLEASGRDRDAGRLLERALDLASPGERAPIQLALGRILARRGAYPEATRLLQEAKRALAVDPTAPSYREAQRHLVATLAAMGLRDGARDALLELRQGDAAIPADLDVYLREWRDGQADRKASRDREVIAGRYRLDRLLGAGASGRVFLATDEVAGRQVAIKMFFAAGARGGAAYERFVREARLASTLRHPSLVEVYDVSVERGFLVMELLPGGSLAQRLAAGERFAGAQVRRLALDVIAGLEAAHHRGVVHRDVKPANIFFDARGTAKLGDFGVSHLVDLGQTQTGGLIGTLAYMSPEQITGAPISIAADLYALGITLFEVITGRLPFLGPDFVAQHLGEPAPAASAAAAAAQIDVDPGWDPILAGLLVKNPRERTGTLADLRRELEELALGGRPRIAPRSRRDSRPHSIAALADAAAGPRYQFETPLGRTPISELVRAVDTVLDRSVVIERFDSSDDAARALDRARALGRAQSPFVQRALSFDRAARQVVYESPSGTPIDSDFAPPFAGAARPGSPGLASDFAPPFAGAARPGSPGLAPDFAPPFAGAARPGSPGLASDFAPPFAGAARPGSPGLARTELELPPTEVIRFLKRLARAVAAIHEVGGVHGAISARTVVLDDAAIPTVLAAGLSVPSLTATAADDVAAVIELAGRAGRATVAANFGALAAALCAQTCAQLPVYAPPTDAETLYAAADALDIMVLTALGSR